MKNRVINICDAVILFSLCCIVFFLPISKAIIESFSGLTIFAYLIKKVLRHESLPKTALNLPLFVYLFISFFSIFVSSNFKISLNTLIGKTLENILLFFIIAEVLNEKRKVGVILALMFLSSLLLGIDGINQYFTHKDFLRHRPVIFENRIYACFPTPNSFGCYLSVVLPFILSAFFAKLYFRRIRFLFIGLFALLFTCLLFTVSRGAWLAFAASALFMSIWVNFLGVFFLIVGILLVATVTFFPPYVKTRLANLFIFIDISSIDRKIIWQAGWKMFMVKPWIGFGLGTFMFNFKKFVISDYPHGAVYAHNCYLQIAAETGIVGLISFLSILVLFFYQGIKIINRNKQQKTFSWYILLACLAAVLGYCVQMGVDTILYSLDLGMLFWLILGMGAALMRNIEEENKNILTAQ